MPHEIRSKNTCEIRGPILAVCHEEGHPRRWIFHHNVDVPTFPPDDSPKLVATTSAK